MSKSHKRTWGFPTKYNRRGKVIEIDLYYYEKIELARHNIQACKAHKEAMSHE